MPSVLKSTSSTTTTVRSDRSASGRTTSAIKPAGVDTTKKKFPQALVTGESSHGGVRSVERSGGPLAASKGSSSVGGGGRSSMKLADKLLRQKVDLAAKPTGTTAASTRVGATRNVTTVNNGTRVKPDSGESVKSEPPCRSTESRSAAIVKSTRTSGTVATQLSTVVGKTSVAGVPLRRSVAETSRREDISACTASKLQRSLTSVTGTGSVKREVPPSSRSTGRVTAAASSQSKTNGSTAAGPATTKKSLSQLKPASGTSLNTGRTAVRQGKTSSLKQQYKTGAGRKSSSSKDVDLSLVTADDVIRDSIAVSPSDSADSPVTPVNSSDTLPLHSDREVVDKSCEEDVAAERSPDQISSYIHTDESLVCELGRSSSSSLAQCEHALKSNSVIVPPPITCMQDETSSYDLEDAVSVCDISLTSCRSDNSMSLFHSACSSIIGSVSDMKPQSLENDDLGMWSGSNSVSMESLRSSASGYCTPREQDGGDNFSSEAADCTLSYPADDTRLVCLNLLLLRHFGTLILI